MFPFVLTAVRKLLSNSNCGDLLPWRWDSGRGRRRQATGVTAAVVIVVTAVIVAGSITVSLQCLFPGHLAELLLIALVQDGRWHFWCSGPAGGPRHQHALTALCVSCSNVCSRKGLGDLISMWLSRVLNWTRTVPDSFLTTMPTATRIARYQDFQPVSCSGPPSNAAHTMQCSQDGMRHFIDLPVVDPALKANGV